MKPVANNTKDRILDAAERLFARDGFHAASLRQITGEAGANVAAVNYHFGTKEALLESVFERRLIPLNESRLERLREVRARAEGRGERAGADEIMRAFVEPTVRFAASGPGAASFILLVGRFLQEPGSTGKETFLSYIMPLTEVFVDALAEALPEVGRDTVACRFYLFAVGAMVHTMQTICDPGAAAGRFRDACGGGPDGVTEMLVDFVTAGIEGR